MKKGDLKNYFLASVGADKDGKTKLEQLGEAKKNVQYLLENSDASVDFHGLAYWASVVEQLRAEIKATL
jgi:hypothetical protein